MRILFCGDIMPGGLFSYQDSYISSSVKRILGTGDIRIGTLESAIGTNLPFDSVKMRARCNIVFARDEDIFRLKEADFNVVSLANNHVCDLEKDGLVNTIEHLDRLGIKHCGAGMNLKEASAPAVLELNGKSFAFLGCCMHGKKYEEKYIGPVKIAEDDSYGINPLNIETIEEDIRNAKKCYDFVIVLPHWGIEHVYLPIRGSKTLAKKMIDAGADAVIGSHPHCIQPTIRYKGKYICFSLGNFMFPDYYMHPPRPMWYPPKEYDFSTMERVVGYPFPIEHPTVHIWPAKARVGEIVILNQRNDRLGFIKKEFVKLSKSNIVERYSLSLKERIMVSFYTMILKYPIVASIYNFVRK